VKHKIPIGDKQNHNTDRKQTGSVKRKIPIIEKKYTISQKEQQNKISKT
jgi:hypothetical protein